MRWLVELAAGALALVGLWVTVDRAAAGVVRVWQWAWRDRVSPLLEDEPYCYPECPEGCDCSRMELPPEQSAADLGFTGPPPPSPEVRHWRDLEAKRKRVASAAEAEQRQAYEAMGFEFPSGLMARVRELTP